MDIDTKLLSRAAALLSEAKDIVERVRTKASDYPGEDVDEDKLAKLSAITVGLVDLLLSTDELAKED